MFEELGYQDFAPKSAIDFLLVKIRIIASSLGTLATGGVAEYAILHDNTSLAALAGGLALYGAHRIKKSVHDHRAMMAFNNEYFSAIPPTLDLE